MIRIRTLNGTAGDVILNGLGATSVDLATNTESSTQHLLDGALKGP